jgi:hypothetical protein
MYERPVDIVKDDFSRVVGIQLERGLSFTWVKLAHVTGGEGTKGRLKSLNFEAKNEAFKN